MATKVFELTANDGSVHKFTLNDETGQYTVSGFLLSEPRVSSTGSSMLLASYAGAFLPDAVSWHGEKYRIRPMFNLLADPLAGSKAQDIRKAQRAAERAQAKADAARARLASLGAK